jgi:succinate dehydrogenase/fumarate reductase flavoprotein subunit
MPDYEPEKMELASRDVVSRRMEEHIRAGHGRSSRFGEHLWLDIRLLGAEHINSRLREVKEICQYFLGIDPAQSLIPVRPAQHYSMGGIRTDYRGAATGLHRAVRRRRGGLLGSARLQPPRRQLRGRDRGRRHARRRVHRRLLRQRRRRLQVSSAPGPGRAGGADRGAHRRCQRR